MQNLPKVYLSHRPGDQAVFGIVYQYLRERLGADSLTYEVDANVASVAEIRPYLLERIRKCDVVVAIMGRTWIAGDQPGLRLGNGGDRVRQELEIALEQGLPVVLVLVEGARKPGPGDLPVSIQALSHLEAIVVRDLETDLELVVAAVYQALESREGAPGAAQTSSIPNAPRDDGALARQAEGAAAPHPARRHEIAGLRPDTADGHDRLGLEREVAALAAVLAARDVQPPLSVGLFGDWGSGKSFFMRELERAVNRYALSARGDPTSPYCERVGQLWFNAWHYMDTDLWASLASEIFEKLAAFMDKQTDDATRAAGGLTPRERLFAAAVNTRDVLNQAEQVRDAARRELEASQTRLDSVTQSEAQIEASLGPRAILQSALKTALAQPGVNDRVKQAAGELHLTTAAAAATEVKAQVLELKGALGYLRGLVLAFRHGGKRIWILSLLVIAAVTLLSVPAVDWARRVGLSEAIARAGAALTALAAILSPVLHRVRKAMAVVQEVRTANDQLIQEQRDKISAAATARRNAHQAEVEKAQQRVEEARTELTRIEQQLEEMRADRQIGAFIKERFRSSDYTKHFGTIARARNDFERLTGLFDKVRKELAAGGGQPGAFPRIDRIVLYIDDLDRCPEDKVFAVMQAVHLLLAMPLFVVVVGVDSRWLVHSLRHQAGALRGREADADPGFDMPDEERIHWQSTPLNYLEKIFQIPFTLRPMEPQGFGDLIDDLVTPPSAAGHSRWSMPRATPPPQARLAGAAPRPAAPAGPAPAGETAPSPSPGDSASTGAPVVSPAAAAQILKIEDWESAVMKRLFPLIPSPRAAKRFVNVYRLLRATVPEAEYDEFVRPEGGDYEIVLLLLAMLTGHPEPTTEILRDLIVQRPTEPWWDFVARYEVRGKVPAGAPGGAFEDQVEAGRWKELWKDLQQIRGDFNAVGAASRFARRATMVARFSFQSGRVLLDKGIEASSLKRASAAQRARRSGATTTPAPAAPGGSP